MVGMRARIRALVRSRTALVAGVAVSVAVPVVTLPRLPAVALWPLVLGLVPWVVGKYVLCPLRWRALTSAITEPPLAPAGLRRVGADRPAHPRPRRGGHLAHHASARHRHGARRRGAERRGRSLRRSHRPDRLRRLRGNEPSDADAGGRGCGGRRGGPHRARRTASPAQSAAQLDHCPDRASSRTDSCSRSDTSSRSRVCCSAPWRRPGTACRRWPLWVPSGPASWPVRSPGPTEPAPATPRSWWRWPPSACRGVPRLRPSRSRRRSPGCRHWPSVASACCSSAGRSGTCTARATPSPRPDRILWRCCPRPADRPGTSGPPTAAARARRRHDRGKEDESGDDMALMTQVSKPARSRTPALGARPGAGGRGRRLRLLPDPRHH